MDSTIVYIAPVDSVGTIILDGPENIGTVVIGDESTVVIDAPPDLVIVAPVAPEAPAIILGPDEIGTVVIGDDSVSVTLASPEITIISSSTPGPPGPAGPPGEGAGEADQVIYDNATYSTVQAALDALLYISPDVTSFTDSVGTVELGTTITEVTLAWSLNKTMTSLSLDHGVGSVLGLTSKSLTGRNLTTDTTWTLSASDGVNNASAQSSVLFRNKRYWGVSASESLDNAGILALSSEFATSFNKSVTYDATGGRFIYYAFPATFGTPSHVTVGGLTFSDFTTTTLSLTNASGHTEDYCVLRIRNLLTGNAIAVVWA